MAPTARRKQKEANAFPSTRFSYFFFFFCDFSLFFFFPFLLLLLLLFLLLSSSFSSRRPLTENRGRKLRPVAAFRSLSFDKSRKMICRGFSICLTRFFAARNDLYGTRESDTRVHRTFASNRGLLREKMSR